MGPTTIFLIFIALALIAIFRSSSDDSEQQSPGEESGRQNGQIYPRPDYPRWGSPPDWRDLQYDYYRRPRIYGLAEIVKAVFVAVMTCLFLFGGIYVFLIRETAPTTPPATEKKRRPLAMLDQGKLLRLHREEVDIEKGSTMLILQTQKHGAISKEAVNPNKLREIQRNYPKFEIEIFRTTTGQYHACIFGNTSEAVETQVWNWRGRNDVSGYGINFKYSNISTLCQYSHKSIIVRGDKSDIWICQTCHE